MSDTPTPQPATPAPRVLVKDTPVAQEVAKLLAPLPPALQMMTLLALAHQLRQDHPDDASVKSMLAGANKEGGIFYAGF